MIMIDDGLIIMAVGMLVVFAFLAIMVFSMRFMSGFILKFFPEKEEPLPVRARTAGSNDAEVAVAIAAAYTLN
jgi:oxaloacetate decarboxylase gamma subunit